MCVWQAVQARCRQVAQDAIVEVQTLDITSPYAELQAAAALADGAFGGAGIDYLVHNAGAPAWPCPCVHILLMLVRCPAQIMEGLR